MHIIAHHGTNQVFDRFSKEHLGRSTKSVSCLGFFFSSSIIEAAEYADLAARNVVVNSDEIEAEVSDFYRRAARLEEAGDWDAANSMEAQGEKLALDALRPAPEAACVLTVQLSISSAYRIPDTGGISSGCMQGIIERAQAKGHDAVIFEDISDSPLELRWTTHIMVFDEDQIKVIERTPASEIERETDEPRAESCNEEPCF